MGRALFGGSCQKGGENVGPTTEGDEETSLAGWSKLSSPSGGWRRPDQHKAIVKRECVPWFVDCQSLAMTY